MKITWLGHSSFLITTNDSVKILLDPFPDTIGYKVYKGTTDIVTISHHHFDHNCLAYLKGDYVVLDKPKDFFVNNIKIKGISSYHDKFQGAKRGKNTIFIFELDGIRVCHLGDLGHSLTNEEIKNLGHIHILLIPVGGNYTIDNKEASEICKKIKSNIVIPMHYKTPSLNFELLGLESFLIKMNNSTRIENNTINIKNIPNIKDLENKIYILKY